MKIIIMYATYSGGTQKASTLIADELKQAGHEVIVSLVNQTNPQDLGSFDLIIFGSPSWEYEEKDGQPHQDYLPFMEKADNQVLNGKKVAIFGLGDSTYAKFCGAVDELEKWAKEKGGMLITPSLRIDGFLFYEAQRTEELKKWAAGLLK